MHGTHFKHLLTLVAISTTVLPAQSVPTRRAVEVLRLGGEDAPAPFDFAEPARLVVDPAGTVYARLPSDGAILVLGPDGRFVRKIGRNGAGPGEFQSAAQHGLIGDTLWVVNWPTPRISLFSVDGNHISTWNTPFDLGQRFASPTGISGLFPGGRAWVLPGGSPVGVLGRLMLPVLIGNRSMTDPDTVTMVPTPRGMSIDGVGTWAFDPMPSPPLVAVSAIGAGIAVASWTSAAPGRVNIRVVSPSGVELLRRQLTLEAQPVPKKVRDSLLALGVSKARQPIEAARRRASAPRESPTGRTGGLRLGGEPPPSLTVERLVENGLDLPSHYPPIKGILLGTDGTIWLEMFGRGQHGMWLALSARGDQRFQVQVQPGVEVQQASASTIWATTRDSLDVPYLLRLNVPAR